jgi:hypothetical protein
MQANLRILAHDELTKKKSEYESFTVHSIEEEAKNCRSAGTYCNGLHLQALARTTNAAIMVWTWEDKLSQWRHFTVAPRKYTNKTKYVYMSLQAQHCQLLRPKTSADVATVKATTDEWARLSITLQPKEFPIIYIGGGVPDPEVLRQMGIDNNTDSSDDSDVRPGSARTSVCRQLGITKPGRTHRTSNATADDSPTEDLPDRVADKRYSTYKCPKCKWLPKATLKPTDARHEAKTHWLGCVGHIWEKADGARRLRNVDVSARNQVIFDASVASHKDTMAKLPKAITKHLCSLNLEVPFNKGSSRTYACSKCAQCYGPKDIFQHLCRKSPIPTGSGARMTMRQRARTAIRRLKEKTKPKPDLCRDTELTKTHLATHKAMIQHDTSIGRFMCRIKAEDYKKLCDTALANDASRTKTQHIRMYRCQRCNAHKTFQDIKKEPCTKRPSTCSYNDCHAKLTKARNHVAALGLTKPVLGKRKSTNQ